MFLLKSQGRPWDIDMNGIKDIVLDIGYNTFDHMHHIVQFTWDGCKRKNGTL